MKPFFCKALLLVALLASCCVRAQNMAGEGVESPAQSRGAIENLRIQKTEEFDRIQHACYQKFAVNDCLSTLNAQRRQLMADLKRQEEAISSSERMQKAAEQLQRLEQKKRDAEQRNAEAKPVDPIVVEYEKRHSQQEKADQHQQKAAENSPREPKIRASEVPAPSVLRQRQAAYAQKIAEANRRKADRDKRMLEQNPTIQGLPKPP